MFLLPDDVWELRTRSYGRDDEGRNNRGIFARTTIRAGTVIGDYLGLLIPEDKEAEYETGNDMYLMYYDEHLSIWPDPTQPGVHLFNHSCEPNCGIYPYRGHGLAYALRRIHPGEELTIGYQIGPIDQECRPCTHLCHCGTRSCSGTMHTSHARYEAWGTFDTVEGAKTTPIPGAAMEMVTRLDRYPSRIADHPVYSLYGAAGQPPRTLMADTLPRVDELRRLIRQSGRVLAFPKLGMTVRGVEGKTVIVEGA